MAEINPENIDIPLDDLDTIDLQDINLPNDTNFGNLTIDDISDLNINLDELSLNTNGLDITENNFDDIEEFSKGTSDFDDLFDDSDTYSRSLDKDEFVYKTVPFKGFYIDFLGLTPNTILSFDVNKLLDLFKLYFDRNKLDHLVNNISGHTYNGIRYEGFVEHIIKKSTQLPENMLHLQHIADNIVDSFSEKWEILHRYINSIKIPSDTFTLSKGLSDIMSNSISSNTSFIRSLRDIRFSESILKELCKEKNVDFLDFIVKRIRLSKEMSVVCKNYYMDAFEDKYNSLELLINEFINFKTEYTKEEKLVLEYLGFPSSLFGKEYKIIRINNSIPPKPIEVELYERLSTNSPYLISRYLTLHDINVINNKTFIDF